MYGAEGIPATTHRMMPPSIQDTANSLFHNPDTTETLRLDALQSLMELEAYLPHNSVYLDAVKQLITFVNDRQVPQQISPFTALSGRLQALKDMLFRIPIQCIPVLCTDPAAMLLMAYLHAVALIAEPIANANSAHFLAANAASIESCCEELSLKAIAAPVGDRCKYQESLYLMEFPVKIMKMFETSLVHGSDIAASMPFQLVVSELQEKGTYTLDDKKSTLLVLQSCPVGLWHNFLAYD